LLQPRFFRDFKVDKLAGLRNTAILAGEENTKYLMYFSIAAAAVSLLIGIYKGAFPVWVIATIIVCIPIAQMRRGKKDFRGNAHFDKTGSYQLSGLLILNAIAIIWLMQSVISQVWL
jgi:4-hydroxybenzoate polyprenyltransferase